MEIRINKRLISKQVNIFIDQEYIVDIVENEKMVVTYSFTMLSIILIILIILIK
jgi:hypothetical protein